jgi:hypothetical protein
MTGSPISIVVIEPCSGFFNQCWHKIDVLGLEYLLVQSLEYCIESNRVSDIA